MEKKQSVWVPKKAPKRRLNFKLVFEGFLVFVELEYILSGRKAAQTKDGYS